MTPVTAVREQTWQRHSRKGEPIWELALLHPNQGEWPEDEYLALNTNTLIEFSDGCLEFLPMPDVFQQSILKFLYDVLNAFVVAGALGVVFFAPLRVRLRPGKIREPDLVFFQPGRLRDVHGPAKDADLAMAVVSGSPEDRKRDLKTKRREYAAARIAEYWIVDPQEFTITVLKLGKKHYRVHGVFSIRTRATSVLLPGFSVAVDEVFAAGEGRHTGVQR
jgi:Uma2 family endonuclease